MSEKSQTEEMKRYIFHEMAEDEFEAVEARYFDDTEYFYELTDLENNLTDRYVRELLPAADALRFEKSIGKVPGRAEKVIAARALQKVIAEEKLIVAASVEPGFLAKIIAFFNPKTPSFQYAFGLLTVFLVCAVGGMFYLNWMDAQELARKQAEKDLADSGNLQQQSIPASGSPVNEQNEKAVREKMKAEEEKRAALEKETEKTETANNRQNGTEKVLKNETDASKRKSAAVNEQKTKSATPTSVTAIIALVGNLGNVSRSSGNIQSEVIEEKTDYIIFELEISKDFTSEKFTVELANGKKLAFAVKPYKVGEKRFIKLKILSEKVPDGLNSIIIKGNKNQEEDSFDFRLERK